MADTYVRIEGLEELQKKLGWRRLLADPIKTFLEKAGQAVQVQAKKNASGRPGPKVQTNRLRSSITYKVDTSPMPEYVEVGTNVNYASPLEYGHTQQVGRFVPIYGMRKEAGGYVVSRGLGLRLKNPTAPAYPFLHPAVEQSKDKANSLLDEAAKSIEVNYER
jgi:hypothetical protein